MRLVDVYEVPEAVDILWALAVERSEEDDPYLNISHRTLPPREKHEAFFASRPFAYWYLVRFGEEWLGYVSVTKRNKIGIVLFRAFRGMGYGADVVKMLIETVAPLPAVPSERPGNFMADINPKNARCIRLFEKLGFHYIQNTYSLED